MKHLHEIYGIKDVPLWNHKERSLTKEVRVWVGGILEQLALQLSCIYQKWMILRQVVVRVVGGKCGTCGNFTKSKDYRNGQLVCKKCK